MNVKTNVFGNIPFPHFFKKSFFDQFCFFNFDFIKKMIFKAMDSDKILVKLSKILDLPISTTKEIVKNCFETEDPFSNLADLLGLENTELIYELFLIKDSLMDQNSQNIQPTFIEQFIGDNIQVKVQANLIETSVLKENKRYFKYKTLNRVQSAVFEDVYYKDGNILISAPTGAGKTEIAILAILRALRYPESVIVYIVPMKALATEIFNKFTSIFEHKIVEYTGDTDISLVDAQARIIVCTPEKFDVASRRISCAIKNIRLVIIDEIHLLEDERGPVLEAIVSRLFRNVEITQLPTRILGLSATLPNYKDVGEFIKAEFVHFFDSTFRPIPLSMKITGFTKIAKYNDELIYLKEAVENFIKQSKQVLIFVHSRIGTAKLARYLGNNLYIPELENTDAPLFKSRLTGDIRDFVAKQIGIHHAGMSRSDRMEIEELFKSNKIKILVCTSTLAWGVNLPAYGVIINGTSFYNPNKGDFDDLGILDILQMFGRAGRPQFDIKGEAILLTKANKIEKYLQLLKRSQDIESRMLFQVPDHLNAEIYLRNVSNMAEALKWLKGTFLCVRMMKNPTLYGVLPREIGLEEQALSEYIYLTLLRLEECCLIQINRKTDNYNGWTFSSTFYGQIASLFYLNHETVHSWLRNIKEMNEFSLLELILRSKEFDCICIRKEETRELIKLHDDLLNKSIIDFDFDESNESKKIILVISYINYLRMAIFSLTCDTDFLIDNLKRLLSAFKEILLHLQEYDLYEKVFNLEKRILRFKMKKMNDCVVKLIRIDQMFVNIKISGPENVPLERSVAFLFSENKIIQILKISGNNFSGIIKCLQSKIKIKIVTVDLYFIYEKTVTEEYDFSLNGLLEYGIHNCDSSFRLLNPKTSCVHFSSTSEAFDLQDLDRCLNNKKENAKLELNKKETRGLRILVSNSHFLNEKTENPLECIFLDNFKSNIEFIEINSDIFNEKLKIMNYFIYNLKMESILIVCPDKTDAKDTVVAMNILSKLGDDTKTGGDFVLLTQNNVRSSKLICSIGDALRFKLKNIETVIFKGIINKKSNYFISDILMIGNGKRTIIMDYYKNLEYIKYLIGFKDSLY